MSNVTTIQRSTAVTVADQQHAIRTALKTSLYPGAADEAQDNVFSEIALNDEKVREAVEWIEGDFEPAEYTDFFMLMHKLHETAPDRLPDSPILPRLYQAAKKINAVVTERLEQMAQEAIDKAEDEAEMMRAGL